MLAILPYLGNDRLPCSGYSIARCRPVPDPAEQRVGEMQHVIGLRPALAVVRHRMPAELHLETVIDEGPEVRGQHAAFASCRVVLAVAGHVV
jgi:hypothetical protein